MDNLSLGILTSSYFGDQGCLELAWLSSAAGQDKKLPNDVALEWTISIGISGRFELESVDGFRRNRWTNCSGIDGRFPPDYALCLQMKNDQHQHL
jgi:hypothetical protein